jgi:hypothetical protein
VLQNINFFAQKEMKEMHREIVYFLMVERETSMSERR